MRGVVGRPQVRIRARGPRAGPHQPPVSRPIDRARRARPPREATALARVSDPTRTVAISSPARRARSILAQYGDRLICVRYRYDAQRKKRFKTVELLVAERDWEPPRPRFAHDQIVGLRVPFADVAVRDRVKQAGGTWNPQRRVWELRYDRTIALGLEDRIVPDARSGCVPSI